MNIQKFENLKKWSEEQWLFANLGDKRRNARAVKLGIDLMKNPKKSLPNQIQSWGDLKSAYRLFNEKDVTYEKLQKPHTENEKKEAKISNSNVVLFIQDTTKMDYTKHKATKGLGPIGDSKSKNRGFFLHNCLAVIPSKNPKILGLAFQKAWKRREKIYKGSETKNQRRKRNTEGDIWKKTIKKIGSCSSLTKASVWVSIGDRGNDIFDFFLESQKLNWHYVLRLCQDRTIDLQKNKKLKTFVRKLPSKTIKKIEIRGKNGTCKKTIEANVAWSSITILPPKIDKSKKLPSINAWVIRCWNEKEDIEWILLSSLPVENNESALEKIDWYSHRWLVEEYHKCLKTGCNIEKSQLKTFDGLLSLLGFFAIIAIRLLQIRYLSRLPTTILAKNSVPRRMLKILCNHFNASIDQLTVKDFYRKVARLGGFLGRKSDGEPGWQTLWKGWLELQTMSYGAYLGAI